MKKVYVIVATVAGGALLAKVLAPRVGTTDLGERIAAMPDTSPPKWIFTNVTAIRANTERILALLDEQKPTSAGEPPARYPVSDQVGRATMITVPVLSPSCSWLAAGA